MEIKKSPKASLENKKILFREIGLLIALGIVYFAFESKSTDTGDVIEISSGNQEVAVEEIVPQTETKQEKIPEKAPEQPKLLLDIINLVADDVVVDDDFIATTDDDDALEIEIKDYVQDTEVVEEVIEEEIPFAKVEEKPKFQGKDPAKAFKIWVQKQLVYPEIAAEMGVQGRVYLQFTVDTDGTIKNVRVVRGVDKSIDDEAMRVVKKSPKWTPGKQRNKPVKVKYTFFVDFQLR